MASDPVVAHVVGAVVASTWAKYSGHSDRIDLMKAAIPEMVEEVSVLRAVATHLEQESTPDAIKRRANVTVALEVRKASVGLGTPAAPFKAGPLVRKVASEIDIQNARAHLEKARRDAEVLTGALREAQEAARLSGLPPDETTRRAAVAKRAQDDAAAAQATVAKIEAGIVKLGGVV